VSFLGVYKVKLLFKGLVEGMTAGSLNEATICEANDVPDDTT